jgi:hypothetical protein
MASTTSGSTGFNLDVDDIIKKAYKPLGGEPTSGEDINSARVALNLILIELQNRNIPLNKIDTESITIVDGTNEYTLSSTVSDVLKLTLKDTVSDFETVLDRYSLKEFHAITKKELEANRPVCYTTERANSLVTIKFWPIPNLSSQYTAEALVVKRVEDVTASYQKIDLPYRYLPLIVRWLSYELSLDAKGIDPNLRNELKRNFEETKESTFEEDRERADFIVVPAGVSGF